MCRGCFCIGWFLFDIGCHLRLCLFMYLCGIWMWEICLEIVVTLVLIYCVVVDLMHFPYIGVSN